MSAITFFHNNSIFCVLLSRIPYHLTDKSKRWCYCPLRDFYCPSYFDGICSYFFLFFILFVRSTFCYGYAIFCVHSIGMSLSEIHENTLILTKTMTMVKSSLTLWNWQTAKRKEQKTEKNGANVMRKWYIKWKQCDNHEKQEEK